MLRISKIRNGGGGKGEMPAPPPPAPPPPPPKDDSPDPAMQAEIEAQRAERNKAGAEVVGANVDKTGSATQTQATTTILGG